MSQTPVVPYKEIVIDGKKYIRPGISPVRAEKMHEKLKVAPGDSGSDENPIIRDGYEYVYSSTGKLVRKEHYDPETMEVFVLKGNLLSSEQIEMMKKMDQMPIVYEVDCPKFSEDMAHRLKAYRPVGR